MKLRRGRHHAASWALPVRGRGFVCAAVATLLAISSVAVVPAAAGGQEAAGDAVVRIVARKLADGQVEVGLQHRRADASWREPALPVRRLLPATATVGRWLASSPLAKSGGDVVVRIVARRMADGRIELGLQQRRADASWGEPMLPQERLLPTTATVGRWLATSTLTVMAPGPAARATGQ